MSIEGIGGFEEDGFGSNFPMQRLRSWNGREVSFELQGAKSMNPGSFQAKIVATNCFSFVHDTSENIPEDKLVYYFNKMKKKRICGAENVYLDAGYSQKGAIALTDRHFFPGPYYSSKGDYLKNTIGDELYTQKT